MYTKRIFIFNATRMKVRRIDLRMKQTSSEELLWKAIRNKKMGYKFKRQYSVGNYIVDFFCKEKRLAIELEGGIHKKAEVRKYDRYRFEYLKAVGVKVLRLDNEEVELNMGKVLSEIKINLTPNPSPDSGEGK